VLERRGMEVLTATTGREAINLLASESEVAIVLMDIMMPEMDGQSAVREIRACEEARGMLSTQGVKIIMTTALDDVKNVVESFKLLCDAYVFKPIDTGNLLDHLRFLRLIV